MASVLASSAVARGFQPQWGQTKDYKIGSCNMPSHCQEELINLYDNDPRQFVEILLSVMKDR
jgi:hypothetical protein